MTFKGRPLYSFAGDSKAGDVNGEGIKDVGTWHAAVTAQGGPRARNRSRSRNRPTRTSRVRRPRGGGAPRAGSGGRPPRPAPATPKRARRSATQPRRRFSTATARPRARSGRATTRASSARSAARSARSSDAGRLAARARPRAAAAAAPAAGGARRARRGPPSPRPRPPPTPPASAGTARWQTCPRAATRACGQVRGQPLLQLAAPPAEASRVGPRRPAADVDQQRRPVDVGAGAGERRGRAARALGGADRGDQDGRRIGGRVGAHRAGLALAELVTARRSATRRSGDGGRSRTDTVPPRDRDVDVVLRPARQGRARRLAPPSRPRRAPAPPPRRRRRPASARSRRRAAAGRPAPRAAAPAAPRPARPRPARARSPIARLQARARAATITGGSRGSRRGTGDPHRDPAGVLDLGARAASTAAAPAAPPPSRRRRPAPPAPRPGRRRPADQSAWPASAICAATRTASSRNGTTATSSTEAVPSSLWPALLTVRWRHRRPSQAAAHAWRASSARNSVSDSASVGVGLDPDPPDRRDRGAEQEDPERACRRRWRTARRCRRSAARSARSAP